MNATARLVTYLIDSGAPDDLIAEMKHVLWKAYCRCRYTEKNDERARELWAQYERLERFCAPLGV